MGFVGSSAASIKSLAVATVPPLQAGETLAALEMVQGIGVALSPLQGVMLTILINKAPQAVFMLNAALSLLAAMLMILVRDSDRYHGD